jgi:hypothetical protein
VVNNSISYINKFKWDRTYNYNFEFDSTSEHYNFGFEVVWGREFITAFDREYTSQFQETYEWFSTFDFDNGTEYPEEFILDIPTTNWVMNEV